MSLNKYLFLLIINIFLLLVGMFVEGNASMIILVPLLAPIAAQYGINEIAFAMAYIFNASIGAMSPPMGTLMFVTCGVTGWRDGAFCEYITMPVERIFDGKGLSPKVLAAIEPFCISYHGVQRAGIRPGDKVLVIGGGTIGVLAANAAKALGGEVYLCDIPQAKEKLARSQEIFGFAGTLINEGPETMEKAVKEITGSVTAGGNGIGCGFDVCIEAVGLPSTFQDCIDCAAFGGKVVLIGVGKKNLDFNFTLLQKKELNVLGSRNAMNKDFEELIDLVKSGKVDLEKVVTDVYDFEDAARAFEDFSCRGGSMLKVGIDFSNIQ